MAEFVRKSSPSSSTAKTALGFGIAGTALAGLAAIGNGGGVVGGLMGAPRAYVPGYGGGQVVLADGGCCGNGLVTEKEMNLIRENSGKDSIIARLEAEKYADRLVEARTAPLNDRVCALETAAAVNAARDQDFRRYVEREFVHQPKASMRESIVVCRHCGCECGHDHDC